MQPEVFSLGLSSMKLQLTSSLASTITRLKHHQTTMVSFTVWGEKQIRSSISEATRRRS
jgi:hypothetical protein